MFFKLNIILNVIRLKRRKKQFYSNPDLMQAMNWNEFKSILKISPFYSELLDRNVPFEQFPVMNKSLFMQNFNAINTHQIKLEEAFNLALEAERLRDFTPMIGNITVGLSTGTSGNRGVFLASEKERAQWVACVLDRVIGFSLSKRTVAFFLRANSNLYDSVRSKVLSFHFFDLLDPIEGHVVRLNLTQPDILVAQPSMLIELAKKVEVGELKIQPIKIISVAEVLYPEDKSYLRKVFGQIIHQVYQCTEGLLASTCEMGVLHFHEDYLIIEKKFLDESKTRFHPIITDTMRSSQPIVRYELNDIIHEKLDCKCSLKSMAIEQIEGRSDDVLTFQTTQNKEVDLFPDFFRRAIVFSDESIQEYALIKKEKAQLNLFVNGSDLAFSNAKKSIEDLLMKFDVIDYSIERIQTNELNLGNKLRRIRNEESRKIN
ncbi:MAG: putative adenylate-forming enzyme [Lentimonas sp.]|jgi:putative adenylate-forming enzyme